MSKSLQAFGVDIPLRSDEAIAADVARSPLKNDEKVADTPVSSISYCGTQLSSRYSKSREFKTMIAMVKAISPCRRDLVDDIFCDSKACATYSVRLRPCATEIAKEIAIVMQAACLILDGGHNGMFVSTDDVSLDPCWEKGPPEIAITCMTDVPSTMSLDWNDVLVAKRDASE